METNNPDITLTLKASEIYQLTLCVGCRVGQVTSLWATAPTAELAKNYESQNNYLSVLDEKLKKALLSMDVNEKKEN